MSKLFSNKVLLKLTVFINLIFTFYDLSSQTNVSRYQRDFYLIGPNHFPYKIVNTKDSGTCVYGFTDQSSGFTYSELTKLDKSGNLIWTKGYTTNSDSVFSPASIQNTIDDGFLLGGCYAKNSNNFNNIYYPILTKINSAGNVIWSKSYYPLYGMILDAKEFSDSTIVLMLGYYTGSIWNPILQKVDKNGNIIWSKKIKDWGYVTEKPNKNILIYGGYATLKEFDKTGNDIWEKNYYSLANYFGFWEIGTNTNNEIVCVGEHMDSVSNANSGLYVLKTNGRGLISFSKKYTSPSGVISYQGCAGNFSKDCGVYLNTRFGFGSMTHNGLLKLDYQGNVQWAKLYDPSVSNQTKSVINTHDNGYALLSLQAGVMQPFTRVVKIDKNGNTACNNDSSVVFTNTVIPLLVDSTLHPSSVTTITNTNIPMITISNLMNIGIQCSDIISQIPDNCNIISTNILGTNQSGISITLFPNPCHDIITLNVEQTSGNNTVQIYNTSGQKILEKEIFEREIKFDLSKEAAGIYFLRISNHKSIRTIKFIKE